MRELQAVLQRALIRSPHFVDEGSFHDALPPPEVDCCDLCRGQPLSENRCADIRRTWRDTHGNISATARLLGLSRTTVYKHLELGTPPDDGYGDTTTPDQRSA